MGRTGNVADFPSHSPSMLVLGGLLLWTGWYGFNLSAVVKATAASGLGARENVMSRIIINTTLAPAFASTFVLSLSWCARRTGGGVGSGVAIKGRQGGRWEVVGACFTAVIARASPAAPGERAEPSASAACRFCDFAALA